jgi:hypothetical protein
MVREGITYQYSVLVNSHGPGAEGKFGGSGGSTMLSLLVAMIERSFYKTNGSEPSPGSVREVKSP